MQLSWLVTGLYVLALAHHAWAMHVEQKAISRQQLLQKQLEMLREAIALSRYGAQAEARSLIDEAVALKATWKV